MFLEMKGFGYYGNGIIKHGLCQRSVDPNDGKECDITIGFAAREWPTQHTKQWLTRCEKFGWPQKKVLEKILSSGCNFVPIGSKQSRQENNPNPELEWRLSFNQAEEKLIDFEQSRIFTLFRISAYILNIERGLYVGIP